MASQAVKLFFNDEIRRFTIEGDLNYQILFKKIENLYPDVKSAKLAWKDADGDLVTFTNDEELKEALRNGKGDVFFVYLTGNDGANVKQKKTKEPDRGQKPLTPDRGSFPQPPMESPANLHSIGEEIGKQIGQQIGQFVTSALSFFGLDAAGNPVANSNEKSDQKMDQSGPSDKITMEESLD